MSNQHIVYNDDNNVWQVKKENAEKATKNYETQKEAINAGRDLAKKQESELIIHKKTGEIREKNSYGSDPYPPKG